MVINIVESVKIIDLQSENHSYNSYGIQDENTMKIDPYSIFLQAMRSPVTKKKYTRRIEMFFDFLQISGDSTKRSLSDFCQYGTE